MQLSTVPLLLVIACLGMLGAGILLLVAGLRYRYCGDEPHCANCSYNLTGVASEVCPECGMPETANAVVYGERYRRWWLVLLGIEIALGSCMLVTSMWLFVPPKPPTTAPAGAKPTSPKVHIWEAKQLIAQMRTICQAGQIKQTAARFQEPRTGTPLVSGLLAEIRYSIKMRVPPQTVQAAALTELKSGEQFLITQILPALHAAIQSGLPADAQALVPLMDQLDKHMDNLLLILKDDYY